MVAYYQRHISAWMDGTEGLGDGEYRVYDVICNLIYLNDGPIVMHESGIAGRCNQHVLAFRKNFASLVAKEKLVVENGKVSNKRASSELTRIQARRRKSPSNPPPTSAQPPPGREGIGRGSAGGSTAKPLKNKEPALFDDPPEKRKEEESTEAIASAAGPTRAELERELYRRGKQVLGKNAGGMITALLKSRDYDIALARSVIEMAATKQDPREYAAAAIKNGGSHATNRPTGGTGQGRGFAAYALARARSAGDEGSGGGAGQL